MEASMIALKQPSLNERVESKKLLLFRKVPLDNLPFLFINLFLNLLLFLPSNIETEDITKVVKSLEDSALLLKRVTKTVQNEVKEQKGGFFSMLLGKLGASLLGNLLAGRGAIVKSQGRGIDRAGKGIGINRDGEGVIATRQGREIVTACNGSRSSKMDFSCCLIL